MGAPAIKKTFHNVDKINLNEIKNKISLNLIGKRGKVMFNMIFNCAKVTINISNLKIHRGHHTLVEYRLGLDLQSIVRTLRAFPIRSTRLCVYSPSDSINEIHFVRVFVRPSMFYRFAWLSSPCCICAYAHVKLSPRAAK